MKNDELFPPETVQMNSPRLAWIKKYGIVTYHSLPNEPDHCWFAGFQDWWITEGETEDEALAALARYCNLPLWNTEVYLGKTQNN